MKWKEPPIIKVYEALSAISDERIEMNGDEAKVYSSSRNKYYVVKYSEEENAIMANDNGSYWQGYLGYPAIAYLMKKGIISYKEKVSEALKGIRWKDLNVKNKNNWEKTMNEVVEEAVKKGHDKNELILEAERIMEEIKNLGLELLGNKTLPPREY